MPFPLFQWKEKPHSYLLFPRKESNEENQTQPKYRFSCLTKCEVLSENKNSPPSLDIKKHKWLEETIFHCRWKHCVCVSFRVQWNICSKCECDRNWRTTFSFAKSEFVSCGTAESTWNHFLLCSWHHAQASGLVLGFQAQIMLTLRNDQLVMYLSRWEQVWDHTPIVTEIAGIIFKWCSSQGPFTCSKLKGSYSFFF